MAYNESLLSNQHTYTSLQEVLMVEASNEYGCGWEEGGQISKRMDRLTSTSGKYKNDSREERTSVLVLELP